MSNIVTIADKTIATEILPELQKLIAEAGVNFQIQLLSNEFLLKRTHQADFLNSDTLHEIKNAHSILSISHSFSSDIVNNMKKLLHLYVNVTWCKSYEPYISTKHKNVDLIVIRENEEDMYAGIEHRQTDEVSQAIKIVSKQACEKVIRFAFEYAKLHNRKKVTCFTKDNIMKQTDGMFHKIFDTIAHSYPDILHEHMIIDIAAAKLSHTPEYFDVIVAPNFYGELVANIAKQITHTQYILASANFGEKYALFESFTKPAEPGYPMHFSLSIMHALTMLLSHQGQLQAAHKIQNAWLATIEKYKQAQQNVLEMNKDIGLIHLNHFDTIIGHFNQQPKQLKPITYFNIDVQILNEHVKTSVQHKELKGVDIFVHWSGTDPNLLADLINQLNTETIVLTMITNRGIKVWPQGFKETFCTDHWRCRFKSNTNSAITQNDIHNLLNKAIDLNIDFIKTENLYDMDGKMAYSLGQGQ